LIEGFGFEARNLAEWTEGTEGESWFIAPRGATSSAHSAPSAYFPRSIPELTLPTNSPNRLLRAALIFGFVAATLEMAALLWFMFG